MHVLAKKTACRRGGWQQRSLACSCSHAAVKQEESILIRSTIFHRGLPLLAQNGKTSCAPARAEAPAACAQLISSCCCHRYCPFALPRHTSFKACYEVVLAFVHSRGCSILKQGGRSLVRGGGGPAEACLCLHKMRGYHAPQHV